MLQLFFLRNLSLSYDEQLGKLNTVIKLIMYIFSWLSRDLRCHWHGRLHGDIINVVVVD